MFCFTGSSESFMTNIKQYQNIHFSNYSKIFRRYSVVTDGVACLLLLNFWTSLLLNLYLADRKLDLLHAQFNEKPKLRQGKKRRAISRMISEQLLKKRLRKVVGKRESARYNPQSYCGQFQGLGFLTLGFQEKLRKLHCKYESSQV